MTDRKRTLALIAACALPFFFSLSTPSFAIYQWTDEQGTVHITDYPGPVPRPADGEKAGTESSPSPSPARQAAPAEAAPAPLQGPPPEGKKIEEQKQPTAPQAPSPRPALAALPTPSSPPVAPQQLGQGVASSPGQTHIEKPETPSTAAAAGPEAPASGPLKTDSRQALAAFVAAFAVFLFAAGVAFYLYISLCFFLIAGKLNVSVAWMSWVPVAQTWPFIASAGKPCWWVLLFFIPVVNFIVWVYLWMCVTEKLGRSKALGLLMLVPVVNLVYPGFLAFSKKATA